MKKLILAAILTQLVACQGQESTVQLDVVQDVEIEFFDTAAGTPEAAVVVFDSLAADPAYQEAVVSVDCVGLDPYASKLEVTAYISDSSSMMAQVKLEVASVGIDNWRPLGDFTGEIAMGAVIPFSDIGFDLDPQGLETLSETLLADDPSYRLRVTLSTDGNTQELSVAVFLKTVFGSRPNLCPDPTEEAEGAPAISVQHGVTVDFDGMSAGEAEEAMVSLGDLRQDPGFAAIHEGLNCAALDLNHSRIDVHALGGDASGFSLKLQIRQLPTDDWIPLVTYEGDLLEGASLNFQEEGFTDSVIGLAALEALAGSSLPLLDFRVEGTSSADLTDLEIDVTLSLIFGTDCETK